LKGNEKIFVLRGGFSKWQSIYGTDPKLVADYDPNVWKEDWWQTS
jgi:hypothetical protein